MRGNKPLPPPPIVTVRPKPKWVDKKTPSAELAPIPMLLWCPECGMRHIDEGPFTTKPHHTHACQHCGNVWRPALVATVGVQFLPGFKQELNAASAELVPASGPEQPPDR